MLCETKKGTESRARKKRVRRRKKKYILISINLINTKEKGEKGKGGTLMV
jgi:hypothetical protein